jgi:hypothetical protein
MEQNANLNKTLKLIGEYYVKAARQQLKADGQYASGTLSKSLDYDIVNEAIEITSARYGSAVDEGSSPSSQGFGKVSNEFVESILDWAMDKNIFPKKGPNTEVNMRKMAYAIGRTIQKDGIIQEYGNSGSQVFTRVFNRLEKRITEDIANAYLKDLETIIDKKINTNKDG